MNREQQDREQEGGGGGGGGGGGEESKLSLLLRGGVLPQGSTGVGIIHPLKLHGMNRSAIE